MLRKQLEARTHHEISRSSGYAGSGWSDRRHQRLMRAIFRARRGQREGEGRERPFGDRHFYEACSAEGARGTIDTRSLGERSFAFVTRLDEH